MRDPVYQLLNDLAVERMRQEEVEGFTPEHDDQHDFGELARAAAAYALLAAAESIPNKAAALMRNLLSERARKVYPTAILAEIKPHSPRRNLVIAGALIMAEIERIDRRDGRQTPFEKQISDHERRREALRVRG